MKKDNADNFEHYAHRNKSKIETEIEIIQNKAETFYIKNKLESDNAIKCDSVSPKNVNDIAKNFDLKINYVAQFCFKNKPI